MAVVQTLIGNIKGPAGNTGPTGATGAQGPAATIEVGTVSTAAYGTPAEVTNSGSSSEAVFDFIIPEGAPGDSVTDMSGLTLNAITTSSASYPTITAGDLGRVIAGKINKFFADIRTAVNAAFSIKSTLPTETDINTITAPGIYYLTGGNTYTNLPSGVAYGNLEVIRGLANGALFTQTVIVPTPTPAVYMRRTNDGGATWGAWVEYTSPKWGVYVKTFSYNSATDNGSIACGLSGYMTIGYRIKNANSANLTSVKIGYNGMIYYTYSAALSGDIDVYYVANATTIS